MIQILALSEKHGRPPSQWLCGQAWGEKDTKLTLAYAKYLDGLCACGQPIVVAHDEDNDGWYETKTSTCHACAARESHGGQDYKPQPGEKVYAVHDPEGLKANG